MSEYHRLREVRIAKLYPCPPRPQRNGTNIVIDLAAISVAMLLAPTECPHSCIQAAA